MPKFTVHLTQQVSYYVSATVEDIEADTPEEAASLAKAKTEAGDPTWAEDHDFLDRGHIDVEVEQDGGPTVGWRED
jgi:hypothetical protein